MSNPLKLIYIYCILRQNLEIPLFIKISINIYDDKINASFFANNVYRQ